MTKSSLGVAAALALAVSLSGAAGASGGASTDSGQPQAQPPAATDALITKHGTVRDALGFPRGVSIQVKRETAGDKLDEVDELNAIGRVIALTEYDSAGTLVSAFRFDYRPMVRSLPPAAVRARATAALASISIVAPGTAGVLDDESTGGWILSWDRAERGIPVRGDGMTLVVWPDGRVESVSRRSHELATGPATQRKTRAEAIGLATALIESEAASSGWDVSAVDLEWVSPNGAFGGSWPIAGDPVYRLAWVVSAVNPDPDTMPRVVTMYFDAESGDLLGGDVVE